VAEARFHVAAQSRLQWGSRLAEHPIDAGRRRRGLPRRVCRELLQAGGAAAESLRRFQHLAGATTLQQDAVPIRRRRLGIRGLQGADVVHRPLFDSRLKLQNSYSV